MREFKIFAVLVIFTAIVYWGVEPYAHSQMHEHTKEANFDFKAEDVEQANKQFADASSKLEAAKAKLAAAQNAEEKKAAEDEIASKQNEVDFYSAQLAATKKMYIQVAAISALKGKVDEGKEAFEANCAGCHRADAAGFSDADDGIGGQGIIIPDLSTAGAIYDKEFLAAIMINPALAMKNNKKFSEENPHPMALSLAEEDGEVSAENRQSIADMVAFLQSIGQKALEAKQQAIADEINASKKSDEEKAALIEKSNKKVVFEEACGRCHDVKYDNFFAKTNGGDLVEYMGSTPPDLSIIIRAKGAEYLHKFINDTQKQLPGTAMPRVGLNAKAQDDVVSYLESVGDSKKAERENLGLYIMGFFVILALLAYGWKSAVWRELH